MTSGGRSITIIMPTYRRPASLARALRAIATLEPPPLPWDVVVIDNDDAPGAEPTVAEHRTLIPAELRLVRATARGAAHARNRGIEEARGDIVAMLDDDVVPAKDWLVRITQPILDERCDATGGRVILEPGVPWPAWLDAETARYLSLYDPADHEQPIVPPDTLLTANAAWDASLLRAIAGFDTTLGPRPGIPLVNDDLDLMRRFQAAGGRVRYIPDAVVVHDLPPERLNRRYVLRRAWAQGRSDWMSSRTELETRPLHGMSRAIKALAIELRRRLRDRPWRNDVATHAVCDLARAGGALREAISWYL